MQFQRAPIQLPTEESTAALGRAMAGVLRPGDTILLEGHIGAGKTAFARAFIRAHLGDAEDVPSPTFTLVQTYETDICEIWHCDLYRLTQPEEVMELGLDDALTEGICLIEWPDRLGSLRPVDALTMSFAATAVGHEVYFQADDGWAGKLKAAGLTLTESTRDV